MRFGIFYEISVPRPWEDDTEHTVYHRCLEQVRVADEVGFHSVWPLSTTSSRNIRTARPPSSS